MYLCSCLCVDSYIRTGDTLLKKSLEQDIQNVGFAFERQDPHPLHMLSANSYEILKYKKLQIESYALP